MTHIIYSHQQLHHKSIARLKQIYNEIGCTVEVSDKRCKDSWISAITRYQASIFQKVVSPATDEQGEFDQYITDQAQAVAPEDLTIVEISFYDHEYYTDGKLIAAITHDHADFVTQRWVVTVNSAEVFRAATPMMCDRYIRIHYKDGTLPVQEEALVQGSRGTGEKNSCPVVYSTENRIMAHIFNECQNYGFEIFDDGIYNNGVKLGEVGCTNGNWWVIRGSESHQEYSDSVFDAVRSLKQFASRNSQFAIEPTPEYLQYRSLEQLTTEELQQLLSAEVADYEQLLDRPFDELTREERERLREYEPQLELVAA